MMFGLWLMSTVLVPGFDPDPPADSREWFQVARFQP